MVADADVDSGGHPEERVEMPPATPQHRNGASQDRKRTRRRAGSDLGNRRHRRLIDLNLKPVPACAGVQDQPLAGLEEKVTQSSASIVARLFVFGPVVMDQLLPAPPITTMYE